MWQRIKIWICKKLGHTWIYKVVPSATKEDYLNNSIRSCKFCNKKQVINFETDEWEVLIPIDAKDLISNITPYPDWVKMGFKSNYLERPIDRVIWLNKSK